MKPKALAVLPWLAALLLWWAVPVSPARAEEVRFVTHDYIELDKIQRISRFRSAAGHDYSLDDVDETCRSMKHYYMGKENVDWAGIKIYSPVDGTIVAVWGEWVGVQLHIASSLYSDYTFKLFHVTLVQALSEGDTVTAGQLLGHHVGVDTYSDIAVTFRESEGVQQSVSFFEVMSDELFAHYQRHGVSTRADLVISKEERDADPLVCLEELFTDWGSLPNWVVLATPNSWDPVNLLLVMGAGGP